MTTTFVVNIMKYPITTAKGRLLLFLSLFTFVLTLFAFVREVNGAHYGILHLAPTTNTTLQFGGFLEQSETFDAFHKSLEDLIVDRIKKNLEAARLSSVLEAYFEEPAPLLPAKPALTDYVSNIQFEEIDGAVPLDERQQWEDMLALTFSKFPASFLEPLEFLRFRNSLSGSRGLGGSNILILRIKGVNATEVNAVAVHELAHLVDLGTLQGDSSVASGYDDHGKHFPIDDPSLDFYTLSWKNSTEMHATATREDFVSGYAMTDPFEDFAESFTLYTIHGEYFRHLASHNTVLAKKYAYMKELFQGKEFAGMTHAEFDVYGPYRPWDTTKLPYSQRAFEVVSFR